MISTHTDAADRIETLPITDEQWHLLMAEPAAQVRRRRRERRSEKRAPHRGIAHLLVQIEDGRRRERYLVRTRDISRHGVGFLHNRPIDVSARCHIALITFDRRFAHHAGAIAACTKRADGMFEVGIRVDSSIALSDFVR